LRPQLNELMDPNSLDETRLGLTLFDVLSLLRTDACDFKMVAQTVKENPVFVRKVFSKVNSPLFGMNDPIRDLQHAVSLLGLQKVRTLLLQATERRFYHHYIEVEGALLQIKKHSVAVGCYAEEMAKELRQFYTPEFYKAALMHDLGKYALLIKMGSEYLKIIKEAEERNYSLHLHEKDELKFDHSELGYAIAQEWNLPEGVQKVIRYHHAITEEEREALTTRDTWLLDIVSFANAVHNAAGARSNRSLFRDYGSDLPSPPGDPSINQLKKISEAASTRALELFRQLGLLS